MGKAKEILERDELYYVVKFGKTPEEAKREKVSSVIANNKMRLAALVDGINLGMKSLDIDKLRTNLKSMSTLCNDMVSEFNRMK